MPIETEETNYKTWSHEDLVKRITSLEEQLKKKTQWVSHREHKRLNKPESDHEFDWSKYTTRLIALKFAYLGKNYNGYEHHANNTTPLPTIEEEIWRALKTARLINPINKTSIKPGDVNWEGCDYSKCGRTDKGVSAFGQVIGVRVRSNRPPRTKRTVTDSESKEEDMSNLDDDEGFESASPPLWPSRYGQGDRPPPHVSKEDIQDALEFDPIADELPYVSILNRLLPADIRVLAWCPAPPVDFSARFSCRERQYRYFFTQPAFAPMPSHLEAPITSKPATALKEGWLDISAMREAARKFIGLHDFRNFCKIDGSKQLTNFERRIFHADITEVEDTTAALKFLNGEAFVPARTPSSLDPNGQMTACPKVYTFTLHGSAFLWHQVRHMVAILFLVGQGLEPPSIVDELLDIEKNPRRPTYEMASDSPLVLWDCVFPHDGDPLRKDAMQWLYAGDDYGTGDFKYGANGIVDGLWKIWRDRKIDEVLAGSLLQLIASQGRPVTELSTNPKKGGRSQRVFEGGNTARLIGTYLPAMRKPLMEDVKVVNDRYARRKGFESAEALKAQGFRRIENLEDTDFVDE